MSRFVEALGLVLVIEGVLWAAFPRSALKMLEAAAEMPEQTIRLTAAAVVAVGVAIVWAVRS
jgi:hypothetical protein